MTSERTVDGPTSESHTSSPIREIPTVVAHDYGPDKPHTVVVECPYCHKKHFHGKEGFLNGNPNPGHRIADCHRGDSIRGYWVRYDG